MNENKLIPLTIDQRRGKIRLFKSTLHIFEEAKNIQLLINTEQRKLAVRILEKEEPHSQTIKIDTHDRDNSCEICSLSLVNKICKEIGLQNQSSIRLQGIAITSLRMFLFSFDDYQKI